MNDGARRQLGRLLGIAIVAGAIVTTLWAWSLSYRHPRTDDAAIRANIVGIAPHVGGPIVELRVVDNQAVRAGDLLFTIDARPYEAKLAAARAALALAVADLGAQRDAVAAAEADLARRTAEEAYAEDYLRRVQPLLGKGFVTADKVEDARMKLRIATASRESAAKDRARAEKLLAEVNDVSAHVEAARASVRSAELDVEYCRVVAPFDAYVTNLNIAVGQYAREGQEVFALVDDREWWVIANFRETYMGSIQLGAEADVFLTAYPRRRFRGVVQGIGWAVRGVEGGSGGVVPAIQPTLDWVRLAQRFPVRIRLEPPEPERPYRMGATAVVTILGKSGDGATVSAR